MGGPVQSGLTGHEKPRNKKARSTGSSPFNTLTTSSTLPIVSTSSPVAEASGATSAFERASRDFEDVTWNTALLFSPIAPSRPKNHSSQTLTPPADQGNGFNSWLKVGQDGIGVAPYGSNTDFTPPSNIPTNDIFCLGEGFYNAKRDYDGNSLCGTHYAHPGSSLHTNGAQFKFQYPTVEDRKPNSISFSSPDAVPPKSVNRSFQWSTPTNRHGLDNVLAPSQGFGSNRSAGHYIPNANVENNPGKSDHVYMDNLLFTEGFGSKFEATASQPQLAAGLGAPTEKHFHQRQNNALFPILTSHTVYRVTQYWQVQPDIALLT